jgi:hypothetical protein
MAERAAVSRLIFGCALIVLFAIDLEHHLLPNAITLPGIVAGFISASSPNRDGCRRSSAFSWAAVCCMRFAEAYLPGPA